MSQQPTFDHQVQFLVNLQRLLEEGSFVASYKFALLSAIADLCVELGDDSGNPIRLPSSEIGQKFIEYYWRQAGPTLERCRRSSGRILALKLQ